MKLCTVSGCKTKLIARGMCSMHYRRVALYGSTDEPPKKQRARKDYTGEVHGLLTVIETIHSGERDSKVRCRCQCGREHTALAYNVRNGNTSSCGCISAAQPSPVLPPEEVAQRKEAALARIRAVGYANRKHGYSRTPTYISWIDARKRCYSPQNKRYPHYGGRGITMCDRWRHSFEAFLADMGPRPDDMTLERIDVNGHYEPSNCTWATQAEQMRNTRSTVLDWPSVREIRAQHASGVPTAKLAERFGTTMGNVWQVVKHRTWKETAA